MSDHQASRDARVQLNRHEPVEVISLIAKRLPKDLIVYVPGTTDPINSSAADHESNSSYWSDNVRLTRLIRELKAEYRDLQVDIDYSWSGDNDNAERIKAGKALWRHLKDRYGALVDTPVALHFIAHSHGGNVVHEFTREIASDSSNYPKAWRIQSIVYLSTPFFRTLNQIDTRYLASDCRLLNVYNDYDFTQRFVANFSMRQILPSVVKAIEHDPGLQAEMNRLKKVDMQPLEVLKSLLPTRNDAGAKAWATLIELLDGVRALLGAALRLVQKLHRDHPTYFPEEATKILIDFLGKVREALTPSQSKLRNRLARYKELRSNPWRYWLYQTSTHIPSSKKQFFEWADLRSDLVISAPLRSLSEFLEFAPNGTQSDVLTAVDGILLSHIDRFDNTVTSPIPQLGGRAAIPLQVKQHDPYFGTPSTSSEPGFGEHEGAFRRFIGALERLESQYANVEPQSEQGRQLRTEMLLWLLAQFDYRPLQSIQKVLNYLEFAYAGEDDALIKRVGQDIERYLRELRGRDCRLVPDEDKNRDLLNQRGSLLYLAIKSHSISRQELWPEVKAAWAPAFQSGANPDYPSYRSPSREQLILEADLELKVP